MKKAVLVIFSIFFAACQQASETNMIVFAEQEQGIEPYQTRILVNRKYLRFDDGEDSINNYLLLDRAAKKLLTVNHQEKTVMVLEMKVHDTKPPFELRHNVKTVGDMKESPSIHGKQPVHYQLSTNDQVCLDVVAVDGLLPEAVAALQEYHRILASDSATTVQNIPADLQEPCMLAMTTFAPNEYLKQGFPVQEWKEGYSRHLLDFKENIETPVDIFTVPKDYFQYTVQQFRDGKVDFAKRVIVEN